MNVVPKNLFQTVSSYTSKHSEQSSDEASLFEKILENMTSSEHGILDAIIVNPDEVEQVVEQVLEQETEETSFPIESLEMLVNDMEENNLVELVKELLLEAGGDLVNYEDEALVHMEERSVLSDLLSEMDSTTEGAIDENESIFHLLSDALDEATTHTLDKDEIMKFNQLVIDIQAIMQQLQDGRQTEAVASNLLALVKVWSSLSKQVDKDNFQQLVTKQLPTETYELMEKLTELYEKRQHFSTKQMYGQDAKVTVKDVARWLTQLLPQQEMTPNNQVTPVMTNEHGKISPMKMSVLEQHTIHVSQGERVERVQQEITQQIANIVQRSNFLQQRNPLQELSIVLKPEHLGTMTIKFTQIDNQLMVKIVTSSSMTRDLLEGNMQQLKHAFSPHQVQVVRDDTIIDEEMMTQEEEEKSHEEEHEKQEEQNKREKTDQEVSDFTTLFNQLQEEEAFVHD